MMPFFSEFIWPYNRSIRVQVNQTRDSGGGLGDNVIRAPTLTTSLTFQGTKQTKNEYGEKCHQYTQDLRHITHPSTIKWGFDIQNRGWKREN